MFRNLIKKFKLSLRRRSPTSCCSSLCRVLHLNGVSMWFDYLLYLWSFSTPLGFSPLRYDLKKILLHV